ncbi:MAG: lysylphosphatidylglycerol synthase domain-containing protein [Gemmatimonadales bacterium]|nr:lysylphosphatidylglycerol synthase domain-containing protein [Gemmatimonadales bacterium]
MTSASRRALKAVALAVIGWFIWRALRAQWDAFGAVQVPTRFHVGWLAVSCLAIGCTYLVQMASWRGVLRAWGQPLRPVGMARIWFLTNLGRYVPGKVWSVAGMVVLAQREGVRAWAAAGGAVAVQALGLATAAAVAALCLPGGTALGALALAAAVSAGGLAVLASPTLIAWFAARVPRVGDLRALPPGALATSVALTGLGWVGYGVAFEALCRGLVEGPTVGVVRATGAFALAYVAGLLVLVAPAGLVVRETMLVGLLAPVMGGAPALLVSVASRLQLTLAEVAAGLLGLALPGPPATAAPAPSPRTPA